MNRYLNEEKSRKQFDKRCVTLEGSEKTFEIAMMGSGEPTVVLINGAGGPIEGWMKCWPLFDGSCTVFAYNRLGVGKSSAPSEPQTAMQMGEDLRNLLCASGIKPPYLLVGHSLGGFIAQAYSSMYPDEVYAVLFLESSTIEDVEASKKRTKSSSLVSSSPVGDPIGTTYLMTEVDCVPQSVDQLKSLERFPQVPITVIAGFHPMGKMFLPKGRFQKRFDNQKKLLDLSNESQLIVAAKSGHFPQMNEPKLVVEAIFDLKRKKR